MTHTLYIRKEGIWWRAFTSVRDYGQSRTFQGLLPWMPALWWLSKTEAENE